MWAECEKLGLAVGFHEGVPCTLLVAVGDRFDGVHEDLWVTEHVAAHPIEQMYACLSFIMGGICERFPGLRIAFLEGNCSWLPWLLYRLDEQWEGFGAGQHIQLEQLPSEYFKQQCFVSVEPDGEHLKQVVETVGADNGCIN